MATTTTATAKMKKLRIVGKSYLVSQGLSVSFTIVKRMARTRIISIADTKANFPISLASCTNFCSRGVLVYSS